LLGNSRDNTKQENSKITDPILPWTYIPSSSGKREAPEANVARQKATSEAKRSLEKDMIIVKELDVYLFTFEPKYTVDRIVIFMPCLFLGIHFSETIFLTFPCLINTRKIGQEKLNSSKKKKKSLFMSEKCFPFLILRKTLSFSQSMHWSTKRLIWWGQRQLMLLLFANVFYLFLWVNQNSREMKVYMDNLYGLHLKHFFFV
jgi:hypothetical protein